MPDDGADRSEEPTPHRLQQAHEKGQFARSQEVGTACIIAAAFIVMIFLAPGKAHLLADLSRGIFMNLADIEVTVLSSAYAIGHFMGEIFRLVFPLFLGVTVASIVAGGMQSGFRLTPKALKFDWNKASPIKGFQRLVDKRTFVQFFVDLLKFTAVAVIVLTLINQVRHDPIFNSPVPPEYVAEFIYNITIMMLLRLLLAIGVVAIIDYAWQKVKTKQDLRMSKQEVKEEHKNQEGDPLMKSARRRMALKLSQKQMMKAVPTADVMVTNPTHFAVALKYERGVDNAPIVLAKGAGAFARRLKGIAREHGVPMVEEVMTARMLYKLGEVGHAIPAELYRAVAAILARVYREHRYYYHRLKARRLEAKRKEAEKDAI